MSDVIYPSDGQVEPYKKKLTGTDDVVMVTASVDLQYRLVSLVASCNATPTDFSFWITGRTGTVFNIINAEEVAANQRLQITDHPMKLLPGESFCCKASAGGNIDVTASFAMLGKSNPTSS